MSNDNTTNSFEELTFSSLLKKYDMILVPMIQRDYAQGRTDKKAQEVRTNILNDIFDKESVHFDLIFGSCEKRKENDGKKHCFVPVDGQQRLTTLFLLFLYAKKVKGLWNDLDLSRFSYDTRRAAADFCKKVATEEWNVSNGKVSDSIKDSVWFMNYWENDPTVAGMLKMLDDIHERAKAKEKDFPNLDNVTFYFFDLKSNGLNENLYLKMNSRGKPLTAFENLKAKIEKVLSEKAKIEKVLPENIEIEDKCFPKCDASPKDSFKEKWKYFMDRNWTETFWDSTNSDKYDVSIAKFIARFLAGYWAAFGQETAGGKTAEDLKKVNRKEQNDKNYSDYIQFEPIKAVLELDDTFPSLAYALTTAPKIAPYWTNDTIKVSDRSEYKFLAVIFTYVLFEGDKDAMRFAWNMAENYVTEYDTFVTYCKRAGEIYKFKCNKNITFCKALSDVVFDGNTSDQLKEEITKAQQILKETTREDGKSWKEVIIEAEKYAFFKGAIRCLFTKEKIGDDWEHFDTKWENAQKYFYENGVKKGTSYRDKALLMKSLLANCDNFWGKIWWYFEFSNDANRWKRILTSGNWRNAVDAIMVMGVTTETTKDYVNNTKDIFIKNIIDDGLMDYVCNNMSGAWIRSTYHGYHAIWISGYPASQVVLNPILSKLQFEGKISYRNTDGRDSTIPNCRYYRCFDKNVDFKYKFNDKYYYFNWWGNPNDKELDVYLTEDNWSNYKYKKEPDPNTDKTDEDSYYCFRVTKEMEENTDLFTKELESLIAQAYPDVGKSVCEVCNERICKETSEQ